MPLFWSIQLYAETKLKGSQQIYCFMVSKTFYFLYFPCSLPATPRESRVGQKPAVLSVIDSLSQINGKIKIRLFLITGKINQQIEEMHRKKMKLK